MEDEVINKIIFNISNELGIESKKVKEAIKEYYKGIIGIIETDKPSEIKMDYFGKIAPKKNYLDIQRRISIRFNDLTKADEIL